MQITIYVSEDNLKTIDSKAEQEGCSRSEYLVRSALASDGLLTDKIRRRLSRRLSEFVKNELEL